MNHITKVFALGGLEEVGKNTYCIEDQDDIIIIDAGLKFPEKALLGVEIIIPDYDYLIKNSKKVKALFITHGHEDHIGGIPYLQNKISIPRIYSPKLASDLIKLKFKNKNNNIPPITEIDHNSKITIGKLIITFFAVTHSIPNSFGICVQTPNGTIVSTGDFKLDWTPLGQKTSLDKITTIGQEGVTLLLSDSTNSEIKGYTLSERTILVNIEFLLSNTKRRSLITTFASNVNRIFWIILLTQKLNKKVAILGRSIKNIIEIIEKRKYFDIDPNIFIKEEEINSYPPHKVVVICTGSQGEPNSIISKIADSEHPNIRGDEEDLIIFSSKPIPGNAFGLENIINKLKKKKIDVYVSTDEQRLHTSGHACQEEQKIMLSLMKPKYFMPMHGDYRMLKIHGETAQQVGMPKENVFICRNGEQIYLEKGKAWRGPTILVHPVFIGKDQKTEESMKTLRERQLMLKSGIIAIIIWIDRIQNKVWQNPKFIVRGSFYLKQENTFDTKLSNFLIAKINNYLVKNIFDQQKIVDYVREISNEWIYQEKKITPLVHPILAIKK